MNLYIIKMYLHQVIKVWINFITGDFIGQDHNKYIFPCVNYQFYHKNISQCLICIHKTQAIVNRAATFGLGLKNLEFHCNRETAIGKCIT